MYRGIAVSGGFGFGRAVVIKDSVYHGDREKCDDIDLELSLYKKATQKSKDQLSAIIDARSSVLFTDSKIIEAQILLLSDPSITLDIEKKIVAESLSARSAVHEVFFEKIEIMNAIEDQYFKDRTLDLKDLHDRLISNLNGGYSDRLLDVIEDTVIVADSLTPSQTFNLDPKFIKGIVCRSGNVTSHAAIVAKNLLIPAVMGVEGIMESIDESHHLFVDGTIGEVRVIGSWAEHEWLEKKYRSYQKNREDIIKSDKSDAITLDGDRINLYSNIDMSADMKWALKYRSDGVGLFRTEYLFLTGDIPPSEDEQFLAYKETLLRASGRRVVFRTMDLGGDKYPSYMQFTGDDNPFMGWRSIRISFDEPDMFKTQLRAILRASAFGKCAVMYPFISSTNDFIKANDFLKETMASLREENIVFDENIEVGAMIETPAGALACDFLTDMADFICIGTNDLIQFTLAVDRGNGRVAKYYSPFHRGVIDLIDMCIRSAKENGKSVCVCGESASSIPFALLLLSLGLRDFSMTPSEIPKVRHLVRTFRKKTGEKIKEKIKDLCDGAEIEKLLVYEVERLGLKNLIDL